MQAHLAHLRERLLTRGASHLSDADLLGVVLGSSQIGRTLTYISSRWIELGRADLRSLPRFGPTRIAQVLALAELSHRITSRPITTGEPIAWVSTAMPSS